MSQTVLYKDYTIRSTPAYQSDTSRWSIQLTIAWEHVGVEIVPPFLLDTLYLTEHEADDHGITFGQRLIDGQVSVLSVDQPQLFLRKGT
jgi:hypothetical protein